MNAQHSFRIASTFVRSAAPSSASAAQDKRKHQRHTGETAGAYHYGDKAMSKYSMEVEDGRDPHESDGAMGN